MNANRVRGLQALALSVAAATVLSACAPLLIGGAVVGGAMVATDRRTSGAIVEDETIELKGASRIREALGDRGNVSVTSYNRIVLLTGDVPEAADKAAAEQVVARVPNVRSVVNEVVIGLDDKDKFNASKPKNDAANFADYVTNPTFPALVETLFPSAKAPTNFPRTDLLTVFLKGIKGLNQPTTVAVPAEMMRLNTSIAPVAMGAQNSLGVAGSDNAGYPNGRRPGDDVVDLSIRVAMGALCVLTGPTDTLQVGCKPTDAPAGGLPFTDGVRKTSANYGATFPYLTTPLPGNFNPPPAPGTTYP